MIKYHELQEEYGSVILTTGKTVIDVLDGLECSDMAKIQDYITHVLCWQEGKTQPSQGDIGRMLKAAYR